MATPNASSPGGGTLRFVFPRWANYLLPLFVLGSLGGALYATTVVYYGFSPKATAVGYQPTQPVPYSHAIHAGELGMDCRYCHTTVEKAAFAAIPPTQTCMNCHTNIKGASPNILPLKHSYETGEPMKWKKIHDLPDYAYFNHAAHVTKGVGCFSCHGRIDQMDVVKQVQPLSMGWCLDCHRNPENNLRPKDQVTNMNFKASDVMIDGHPATQEELGLKLKKEYGIRDSAYMTSCYTCHR
jgi:hypothetical protein